MYLTLIGSTIIAVNAIAASWLMRRHLRLAQWMLLLNQCVWIIYGPLTHQWGLAVSAFFFGAGMLNNLTGYVDWLRAAVAKARGAEQTRADPQATVLWEGTPEAEEVGGQSAARSHTR